MNAAEERILKEHSRRLRMGQPSDGGERADTYEGWKARGRGLRKGAARMAYQGKGEAPAFDWADTYPLHPREDV